MKNMEFIRTFELGKIKSGEKPKDVKEIFNGTRRRMVQVNLRNSQVLSKHKANEPITVFFLAGSGTLRAGRDLEDYQKLAAGTLITLEGGVEHGVIAEPELSLLVTKFKSE
jgi:quercetin dioxygenase-like cupin family protein